MNLSFPDGTYSSSNKPSSATLKTDLQTIETDFNAHEADTSTHGVSGAVVGTTDSQTLTNKAITFTDTTIGMNVKCRVTTTAGQVIADSTPTKITLSTETYDVGNDFDAATNYRFTAPVTGYYFISSTVNYSSAGDGSTEQIDIKKGGSSFVGRIARASGTSSGSVDYTDVVALNATDYLELWFNHSTGAGETVTASFTVHLLSI